MSMSAFDVHRLPGLLSADPSWLNQARQRQAAVWRGAPPSPPAIGFSAPLTPAQEQIPDADFHTAFYDADRMLCSQVRASCGIANAHSDGIPSIRANLGTGILLACVGLEQDVFTDKMPWLQRHMSKDEVSALTPDDLRPRGSFARGLEMMERFKAVMGDALAIYCMDTQGPFDLAHLMIGDALFYEMTDDPPFVHHLMELCLELGIRTHTWMKEITGEPRTAMHHSNAIYTESAGIRICEDTTALLGPEQMAEFAIPYSRRLAAHFGGAWIHYCGRNDHLTDAVCAAPEFAGINFGFIPGHEHDHNFEADMARCQAGKKVYFGHWPLLPGETGEEYLRRIHPWAQQGVIIGGFGNNGIGNRPGFLRDAASALAFWNTL